MILFRVYNKGNIGAREMTQHLRVLATFPEILS